MTAIMIHMQSLCVVMQNNDITPATQMQSEHDDVMPTSCQYEASHDDMVIMQS